MPYPARHIVRVLSQDCKWHPALSLYKNVLKINPQYKKAYFDIGVCLDKLGNQREAKRYYHKFLECNPQDEHANYVMKRVNELRKNNTNHANLSLV